MVILFLRVVDKGCRFSSRAIAISAAERAVGVGARHNTARACIGGGMVHSPGVGAFFEIVPAGGESGPSHLLKNSGLMRRNVAG